MSVRSLGRLTLDLVLQTGNFLGPMDQASRTTRQQMRDMSVSIKQTAGAVTAVAAASAAAAGALVTYTNNAAQNAREIRNQAQVANTSVQEFQRMAYGASSVGIEQDKLADILKDVNDRIGDFNATGGGPMADFFEKVAPKVGVTAEAFRNLSGPQALQLYYDSLEKANLSQADMTFYLEAMAGDTTNLIPLLRNGGERLGEMADEADNLGIVMSELEIAQLEEFAGQFDRSAGAIKGVSNALASDLAPYLSVTVDYLFNAVEGADGFREAMSSAVYESVAWMARFIDEFLILDKEVQVGTARMSLGFAQFAEDSWASISWLIDTAIGGINNLIRGMNFVRLTDLDLIETTAGNSDWMQGFRDRTAAAREELSQLSIELFEMVTNPGPGAEFMADVQAKIEEIKAGIESNDIEPPPPPPPPGGDSDATEAIEKQIAALERQVETLGMAEDAVRLYGLAQDGATKPQLDAARAALETIAAYEASEKAAEDYQGLLDDLRTTEERLADQMLERMAILDAANVSAEEYAQMADKIRAAAEPEQDEGYWDRWLEGAENAFKDFDQLSANVAESFSGGIGDALEGIIFDLEDAGDAGRAMLEGLARSTVNALGQMAGQWLAYQAVQLAVGKTTQAAGATAVSANAQAGVFQAGINAFSSTAAIPIVGPAMAPAAMAAAIGATQPLAASVSAAALAGMAHDGIDSVPETGTWLLQKGERVTTADTSAKLDATLARVEGQMNRPGDSAGAGGGMGSPVIHVDARGATDPAATELAVNRAVREAINTVGQDFATNGKLRRQLGV